MAGRDGDHRGWTQGWLYLRRLELVLPGPPGVGRTHPPNTRVEQQDTYPQGHAKGVAVGLSVVLNLQPVLTWLSLL